MKNFLFVIIIIFFISGVLAYQYTKDSFKNVSFHKVEINNVILDVIVAQTQKEKTQGLSGRDFLGKNQGMLFVYDTADLYSFWTKDMKFPIDIIFIDNDYTIIDIYENVLQNSFPKIYQPKNPAQYVLEVNAGFSKIYNISVGDSVSFLF